MGERKGGRGLAQCVLQHGAEKESTGRGQTKVSRVVGQRGSDPGPDSEGEGGDGMLREGHAGAQGRMEGVRGPSDGGWQHHESGRAVGSGSEGG